MIQINSNNQKNYNGFYSSNHCIFMQEIIWTISLTGRMQFECFWRKTKKSLGLGPPEVDYYFTFCLISFFHCIFFHYSIYHFLLSIEMFVTYLQLKFLPKSFDYLKYLTKYVLFKVTVDKLLCSSDAILKVHALGMTQIKFGSN